MADVKTVDDLIGPGAKPGTVPTDMEQSTGMERLEILGKMEGVDVFDMRPLDASRKGTMKEPILVRSAGDEQYAGCTGFPVDSHSVIWLTVRLPYPEKGPRREQLWIMLMDMQSRSPANVLSSGAPSAVTSTRWSTSVPRATTTTAMATITTAMRSPRTSATSSSRSTGKLAEKWSIGLRIANATTKNIERRRQSDLGSVGTAMDRRCRIGCGSCIEATLFSASSYSHRDARRAGYFMKT